MNDELTKLNLVELLERMADIEVPEPISYWPQTVGWLVSASVILAIIGVMLWRSFRRRSANRYRIHALQELSEVKTKSMDTAVQLTAVAGIVRRVALVSFPRQRVASLFGDEWLSFLERTGPGVSFTEGPGRLIATAPYQRDVNLTPQLADAVNDLAVKWISTHQAGTERA